MGATSVNHYKSTAFDNIEPLFVAKYGPPDKSEVQEIESVTGVKYQSREERWMRDSRIVSLSERGGAGKVDRMSIVILTGEYSSFVEKMKKEKLKNDGKRL